MVEFNAPRPGFTLQQRRFYERCWNARLDALARLLEEADADLRTDQRRMTMTALAARDAYGELIEPTTLKIERLLPGPIERAWAYLTESDKRRQWLAAGDMEMEARGAL